MQTRLLGLCALFLSGGMICVAAACSDDDTRPGFVISEEASVEADAPDAAAGILDCVPGTSVTATQTIGANGGTLSLDTLTLTIPSGALPGDQKISVTSSQSCPWPADGFTPISPMYTFAPAGLEFAHPVSIAIGYAGAHHAAIFEFTNDNGDLADAKADNTGSVLSAEVTHLGTAVIGNYREAVINPGQPAFFAAIPSAIDPGAHATLHIDANNNFFTSDCSIDNGEGPVSFVNRLSPQQTNIPTARLDVAPAQTTTYTLSCPTEKLNLPQTITVSSPPLLTLKAEPTSVVAGASVNLTWTVGTGTTFDSCSLNGNDAATFGGSMALVASPLNAAAADAVFSIQCFDHTKHMLERRVKVTVNNATTCTPPGDLCDPSALSDPCCAPTNCDSATNLCQVPSDAGVTDSGTDSGHDGGDSGITDAGSDADADAQ